ncbi:MAG: TIGR03936 family radical SAM-associated protein [Synergistaceae bacterium]|jgi:radical SAM-linked protein|nr:TIGR03936 family radical SAM-associated protein [Synergistaceae bacterium]
MTRVRLFYEKRGGACFVPHVAMVGLFTRVAARGGIKLSLTEGFSPHAKMSFGPELPAGVLALCEPVDLWLEEDCGYENLKYGDWEKIWNEQMPRGFRVVGFRILPPEAPALGKDCRAAHYLIQPGDHRLGGELLTRLKEHYGEDALSVRFDELDNDELDDGRGSDAFPWISLVLGNPAGNGIGGWVKSLTAANVIAGWQDLRIVRIALGRWSGTRLESLNSAALSS